MITCVECGERYISSKTTCPNCGSPPTGVEDDKEMPNSKLKKALNSVKDKKLAESAQIAKSNPGGKRSADSTSRGAAALAVALKKNLETEHKSGPQLTLISKSQTQKTRENNKSTIKKDQTPSQKRDPSTNLRKEPTPSQQKESSTNLRKDQTPSQQRELSPTETREGPAAPKSEESEKQHPIVRPPVLASESLLDDIAPLNPQNKAMRILLIGFGILGCALSLLLVGINDTGLLLVGAFLALVLLGIIPIPYTTRAAAAAFISASALTLVTWLRLSHTEVLSEASEIVAVTFLCMALFFRAWHRASYLARTAVVIGIIMGSYWLVESGTFQNLIILDSAWQSWLPVVIKAPFALLLMLSLLAFIDSQSTGACGLWAMSLLIWHGLYVVVDLFTIVWAKPTPIPTWSQIDTFIVASLITSPLLITLVSFSTAQVLASSVGILKRKRTRMSSTDKTGPSGK